MKLISTLSLLTTSFMVSLVSAGGGTPTTTTTTTTNKPGPTSTTTTTSTYPSPSPAPSQQCFSAPKIITIIFENQDRDDVLADPYFGTVLKPKGYFLNNMHGVSHPSQGNYIAMVAGDQLGVVLDNDVNLSQVSNC
jgi:acid phosphatase